MDIIASTQTSFHSIIFISYTLNTDGDLLILFPRTCGPALISKDYHVLLQLHRLKRNSYKMTEPQKNATFGGVVISGIL